MRTCFVKIIFRSGDFMRKKSYDKLTAKAEELYQSLTDEERKQMAVLGITGCLAAKKDLFKFLRKKEEKAE